MSEPAGPQVGTSVDEALAARAEVSQLLGLLREVDPEHAAHQGDGAALLGVVVVNDESETAMDFDPVPFQGSNMIEAVATIEVG